MKPIPTSPSTESSPPEPPDFAPRGQKEQKTSSPAQSDEFDLVFKSEKAATKAETPLASPDAPVFMEPDGKSQKDPQPPPPPEEPEAWKQEAIALSQEIRAHLQLQVRHSLWKNIAIAGLAGAVVLGSLVIGAAILLASKS